MRWNRLNSKDFEGEMNKFCDLCVTEIGDLTLNLIKMINKMNNFMLLLQARFSSQCIFTIGM